MVGAARQCLAALPAAGLRAVPTAGSEHACFALPGLFKRFYAPALAAHVPTYPLHTSASQLDTVPVVHGSALFTRGETQSLCTVTVGGRGDEQRTDSLLEGEGSKRLAVHYAFPAFAIKEVRLVVGGVGGEGWRDAGAVSGEAGRWVEL